MRELVHTVFVANNYVQFYLRRKKYRYHIKKFQRKFLMENK